MEEKLEKLWNIMNNFDIFCEFREFATNLKKRCDKIETLLVLWDFFEKRNWLLCSENSVNFTNFLKKNWKLFFQPKKPSEEKFSKNQKKAILTHSNYSMSLLL